MLHAMSRVARKRWWGGARVLLLAGCGSSGVAGGPAHAANNVSYLLWAWQAGTGQLDLVSDGSGAPNPPEGPVYPSHLAGL
jgi:hypothetical protein